MDAIQKNLLAQVADLHEVPSGAYNIRENGVSIGRSSSANIEIVPKSDADGIDIVIRPGTRRESVHIPVLLSESGITETVYNDFYIGEIIFFENRDTQFVHTGRWSASDKFTVGKER